MPVKESTSYVLRTYRARNASGTTDANEPSPGATTYIVIANNSWRSDPGPVPGYQRLISSGANATSLLEGVRRTLSISPGGFACRWKAFTLPGNPQLYNWTVRDGDFVSAFSPNEAVLDFGPAIDKAKMQFVNRALAALGSLEGQVFLGEIGQTLRMIKSPAQALRNGFSDYFDTLRKRRRPGMSKRQKREVLADTWLEYKFGWQPLISDLDDGLNALRRISERRPAFKPIFASGVTMKDISPAPELRTDGGVSWIVNRKYTCTASAKIFGVISLDVDGLSVPRSELGFRLDRFVPTLWELIPYSFVADYFSNIGDVISSWSFGTKHVKWAQLTTRRSTLYELRTTSFTDSIGGGTFTRATPCESRGECISFTRSPSIGTLVPSFRIEIPGMSSTKWLNLAALATKYNSLRPY